MSDDGYKSGPDKNQVMGCLAAVFVSYFIASTLVWEVMGGCTSDSLQCDLGGIFLAAVSLAGGFFTWKAITRR